MEIKFLFFCVFLVICYGTTFCMLPPPKPKIVLDPKIKTAKNLMTIARQPNQVQEKKISLLSDAAKLFEQIVKETKEPSLRSDALSNLRGIYLKYPTLINPDMIPAFHDEVRTITISGIITPEPIQNIQSVDFERKAVDHFKTPERRKEFNKKVFGTLIQNDLIRIYDELFREKDYLSCSEACWKLIEIGNPEIKKIAIERLESLRKLKCVDATYYLAFLNIAEPSTLMELFLEAENNRDLKQERKNYESNPLDFKSADHINKMIEKLKLLTHHQNFGVRASKALSKFYYNQAKVFPQNCIFSYRTAAQFAKKVYKISATELNKESYANILHLLGVALHNSVYKNLTSQEQPDFSSLSVDLSQAEMALEEASKLQKVKSSFVLGIVQQFQVTHFGKRGYLNRALSSFMQAGQKNNKDAIDHLEMLLVEGIDTFSLTLSQREMVFNLLKSKKRELCEQNDFKTSRYYEHAQTVKITGALEFYEALFLFDRGIYLPAIELLERAIEKNYRPASFLKHDVIISTSLYTNVIAKQLEEIDTIWKIFPSIKSNSGGEILLAATESALNKLIEQNNIDAIYMSIIAQLHNFYNNEDRIKRVIELLQHAEKLFIGHPSHHLSQKLMDDSFIADLLSFSETTESLSILHGSLSIALARLNRAQKPQEINELIKFISMFTKTLNEQSSERKKDSFSNQRIESLIQEIDLFLQNTPEKKEFFPLLRSLKRILKGERQESLFDTKMLEQLNKIEKIQKEGIIMEATSKEYSSFFDNYAQKIVDAIRKKNDSEILAFMRYLIKNFRESKQLICLYNKCHAQSNLSKELQQYIHQKEASTLENRLVKMNLELLMIADLVLTNDPSEHEKLFDQFYMKYPLIGGAMLAREFAANELFSRNLDRSKQILIRIAADSGVSPNAYNEVQKYIELTKRYIESQH